jgi:hypothetical protein
MRSYISPLVLFLVFMIGVASPAAAKRVALVIANSDYEHTGALENPKNDARALADAFRRLHFDSVTLKENLDYRNLRLALKDFASESAGAELAVVYFAGHGIEVAGQNYLIPVDARLDAATDIDFEGIPLPSVLSSVEGADKLKLVILDACRNNPFRARMIRRSGTRSIGRGLAKVEPEGHTLVAFAAKEGTVALDGDGTHSPYANALLQVIEQPGVEIGFLFRRVRDMVLQATGLRQEPFTYGSLGGTPIYLKEPEQKVADVAEKSQSDERIATLRKELDELKRQFSLSSKSDNKTDDNLVVASADTKTRENTSTSETESKKESDNPKDPSTQDEFAAPEPGTDGSAKIASAQPAPTAQEEDTSKGKKAKAEEQASSRELVTNIQSELARLGCNPGPADGLWGLRTSSAISDLNSESGQKLNATGPDQDTLDALRTMKGVICKAPATPVVKTRPTQPAKKTATKKPAQKGPKKDRYWGGEDTRIQCEAGIITDQCFPQ